MVSDGNKGKFIVVVADGIEKYKKNLEAMFTEQRMQVSLDEAAASVSEYDRVIWVHPSYTPKDEGIEMIAKSLGIDKEKIAIPKASTINELLSTREIPKELSEDLDGSKGKSLLICMAGNTSLMTAQVLASKGIVTESLNGGITNLPEGMGKNPGEFIKAATE
jgi:rhodanese-related sulfurtransferase